MCSVADLLSSAGFRVFTQPRATLPPRGCWRVFQPARRVTLAVSCRPAVRWNTVGSERFDGWLLGANRKANRRHPAGAEAVSDLIARFVRLPALHV